MVVASLARFAPRREQLAEVVDGSGQPSACGDKNANRHVSQRRVADDLGGPRQPGRRRSKPPSRTRCSTSLTSRRKVTV